MTPELQNLKCCVPAAPPHQNHECTTTAGAAQTAWTTRLPTRQPASPRSQSKGHPPRATARPALAPQLDSGVKRMVAPFEPPVPVFLSWVPEVCLHPRSAVHAMTSILANQGRSQLHQLSFTPVPGPSPGEADQDRAVAAVIIAARIHEGGHRSASQQPDPHPPLHERLGEASMAPSHSTGCPPPRPTVAAACRPAHTGAPARTHAKQEPYPSENACSVPRVNLCPTQLPRR